MPDWSDLGLDNLRAAKSLLHEQRLRSSVSRAYYAAYSAVTGELVKRTNITFAYGRGNPSHFQVVSMMEDNFRTRFGKPTLRRLKKLMSSLRRGREVADYIPGQAVDRTLALGLLRDASFALHELGVRP